MGAGFIQNGIFLAIVAHALIGASLIWDKVLLRRPGTRNLLSYVFWLGFISIFGLLLMPFGFHMPGLTVVILALAAGLVHLVANFFYYAALKAGEASQTLAIMGGFSPVATALISRGLLRHPLGRGSLLGFVLLVGGGFLMFFSEKLKYREMLPSILIASASFGLVNVMQKLVFDATNFVSGYVFFTFGTFIATLALLIRPSWRAQIFESSEKVEPRSHFWYFVNRFMAGAGSFLIFFAISETSPALVEAIAGLRYVVIFLAAYGITKLHSEWLSEDFSGSVLVGKTAATVLVVAGLVLLGIKNEQNSGVSQMRAIHMPNRIIPYSESMTTPAATRATAAQRRHRTCSLRMYLANNVSRT
jgi:drug/metabolite transporter (DMT)-like permease